MAKRSRRDGEEIRLSEAQMVRPGIEEAVSAPSDREAEVSPGHVSELAEEYDYVVADLRRIGAIAVVMLAALVGLAFLLP